MKRVIANLVMVVLLAGVIASAGVMPARGQAQTTLAVLPSSASLVLGTEDSVVLNLYLADAVAINAFDVTVTYNPAIVSFTGWAHGGFLTNLSCFYQVNNPGFFRLACTQLASPGVSGEGNLLTLTFEGLSPGTSAITISNAELADKFNVKVYPLRLHGSITAAYDPALLDQYPLTGSVGLQGQVNRGGVPVSLGPGQTYQIGPYTAISLDQQGVNLNFGQVVGDTYVVTTNQPSYLNLHAGLAKRVTVTAAKTALNPLRLVAGNARWSDNVINAGDLSVVGAWFGKTLADLAPGETLAGDVNFDGIVDLRDFALVCGNYGLTAVAAYSGWTP